MINRTEESEISIFKKITIWFSLEQVLDTLKVIPTTKKIVWEENIFFSQLAFE